MKKVLIFLFILTLGRLHAQVPNVTLTNVVDGSSVSLDSYLSSSGVIIIFTSNACPFDEYYRGRINKLAKDFGGKVPVLLVNSHTDANESADAMTKKAQQLKLSVPYLADKDQTLMQALKATKSPQAFLLKNVSGKLNVIYTGALDDNAQVEADVHTSYLRDAVNVMLTNHAVQTPEVRPVGCNIRKK